MTQDTGSRYFRLQRFRALLKQHLGSPGRFNGEYLTVEPSSRGLLGLVGGHQTEALRVDSSSGSLFHDDWEDLSIGLYRRDLLARVLKLGEAYEQLTERTVTVVCYFPPDSDG
jgi:hypothetical protein